MPVFSDISSILLEFGISKVVCHGENSVVSSWHPQKCSDDIIIQACDVYHDLYIALENLTPGQSQELNQQVGGHHLMSRAYSSLMPKIRSLFNHAVEQLKKQNSIGATPEDDVEWIHQESANILSHVSRMKYKGHSRVEVIFMQQ